MIDFNLRRHLAPSSGAEVQALKAVVTKSWTSGKLPDIRGLADVQWVFHSGCSTHFGILPHRLVKLRE